MPLPVIFFSRENRPRRSEKSCSPDFDKLAVALRRVSRSAGRLRRELAIRPAKSSRVDLDRGRGEGNKMTEAGVATHPERFMKGRGNADERRVVFPG